MITGTRFFSREGRNFDRDAELKHTLDSWRRFCRLGAPERGIVLESAAAIMATRLGLGLMSFRNWKALLNCFVPASPPTADPSPKLLNAACSIAQREASAARHLFLKPNCLERSLALWWLLRRREIPAELRFGGRKAAGKFEAHAWVEVAGIVFDGSADEHSDFSPFRERAGSTGV